MRVREALVHILRAFGVDTVFGLIGRANMPLVVTVAGRPDMQYVPARHENAAVSMADGYARTTGRLGVCTVTLGPGVTNGLTALVEASKARTPLLLLTGDSPPTRSSSDQHVDQPRLFAGLDLPVMPVRGAATAPADLARAAARAVSTSEPVVVPVRLDLHEQECTADLAASRPMPAQVLSPSAGAVSEIANALVRARQPVIIAGRGAGGAAQSILSLADRVGALVATTMHARGLFKGYPFAVGTAGVHGTSSATELLSEADCVLGFGASLNRFTTRAGHLFPRALYVIRCDVNPLAAALAPATLGVVGNADACARAVLAELERRGFHGRGFHLDSVRQRLASETAPTAVRYGKTGRLRDARPVLEWLDRVLPRDRGVVCDTGHATGYALESLSVYEYGRGVYPYFFQSIGLALGMAAGVAVGQPGSIVVAAMGDGALLMSLGELETLVRQRLPVLVLVMNDAAYGAELRELEQLGEAGNLATFSDVDFAAVSAAMGAAGLTVRSPDDLEGARPWINSPQGPFVLDCKLDAATPADWFVEAIAGPDAYLRNPVRGW